MDPISELFLNTLQPLYNEPFMPYMQNNYTHVLPFSAVALYLLMVFGLPKVVKPGKPSSVLKVVMASWNLFLTVASAIMLIGMSLPLYEQVQNHGLVESICDTHFSMFTKAETFWTNLFVFSKYAELIDTLLLILKNPERPVPFLHYYHHASVLLVGWYSALFHYSASVWFGVINASVHTIMYFYYFQTELGYRPSWAIVITFIQILQMVLGIILNAVFAIKYFGGANCQCDRPRAILAAALVMYSSYLYLFVKFFINRYSRSKPKQQ